MTERQGSEKTYGIPTGLGGESVSVATRVVTAGDVGKSSSASSRVQEGIQESKLSLALGKQFVVDQRDDRCESGGSARGSIDTFGRSTADDFEIDTLGGDVRESTSGGVEFARVGRAETGDVGFDDGGLVRGLAEVVGEATG